MTLHGTDWQRGVAQRDLLPATSRHAPEGVRRTCWLPVDNAQVIRHVAEGQSLRLAIGRPGSVIYIRDGKRYFSECWRENSQKGVSFSTS